MGHTIIWIGALGKLEEQARLLQLLLGSLSLPKANSTCIHSTYTSPAHLSIIGGGTMLLFWKVLFGTHCLSAIRNSEVVHYSGAENVLRL